jgi:anti-sigma-K factor RskA
MGKLSSGEAAEVEAVLRQYPEVREELEAIELALERFALSQGIAPPPGQLESILGKVDETSAPVKFPKKEWKKPSAKAGAPASQAPFIALAAGLLLAALFFFWQWQRLNSEAQRLRALQANMTQECDALRAQHDSISAQLTFLRAAGTLPVLLRGTDLAPLAAARVYYNQEAQQAYFDATNLPSLPPGKDFQLWAIVNNQPVDMGVFTISDNDDDGSPLLKALSFVPNAQAFAITLENIGGSATPTLDQMILIGAVG